MRHSLTSISLSSSLELESSDSQHIYEQLPDYYDTDYEQGSGWEEDTQGLVRSKSEAVLGGSRRPPPPPPSTPYPRDNPWIMLPASMPGLPVNRSCIKAENLPQPKPQAPVMRCKSYDPNLDEGYSLPQDPGPHPGQGKPHPGQGKHVDISASMPDLTYDNVTPEQCVRLSESITKGKVRALAGPLAALFMKAGRRGAELPGTYLSYHHASHSTWKTGKS